MAAKAARARVKINHLLNEASWQFFDDANGPANIVLEPSVKITTSQIDAFGEDLEGAKNGFIDFLLLDSSGKPLIVLEAKSEDKNPLVGKEQARKYPFIRTSDVGAIHLSDHFVNAADRVNEIAISELGLRLFPSGTILFPKSGASTFLNHRVVMGDSAFVSSHLDCIICDETKALPKFVYHLLCRVDAREITPDQAYPTFLIDSADQDELEYATLDEEIEVNLIHRNYASRKDIDLCLGYDIQSLKSHPKFAVMAELQGTLRKDVALSFVQGASSVSLCSLIASLRLGS